MNANEMTIEELEAVELDKMAPKDVKDAVHEELWKRRKANVEKMHAEADANWAASTPEEIAAFNDLFTS